MTRSSTILKTQRAEDCLREILSIASGGLISNRTAGVLINGVQDRAGLLICLRGVKLKATEAEVLLRSIDKRDEAVDERELSS